MFVPNIVAFVEPSLFNGRTTVHEFLWFLIGFVGFLINLGNMRDAQNDLDMLELLHKNGWMKRIVEGQKADTRDRVAMNVIVMLVGILAMFVKPATHTVNTTLTTLVLTVGLFSIVLVSIATPLRARKLRRDFLLADPDPVKDTTDSVTGETEMIHP